MKPLWMTTPLALAKPGPRLAGAFLKSKVARGQQVPPTLVCGEGTEALTFGKESRLDPTLVPL